MQQSYKEEKISIIMLLTLFMFGACSSCDTATSSSPTSSTVSTPSYETRRYTPPATTGNIYVVLAKTGEQSIYLSVKWGGWSRTKNIEILGYDGLVLHLKHLKNDSVTLVVRTDAIFITEPYQGEEPQEWGDDDYKKVSW
jgi:hypothetical protein